MTPVAQKQAHEAGTKDVRDALEKTTMRLRRIVNHIRAEGDSGLDSETFEAEVRRARRQIRNNKQLLKTGSSGD
jgi:hypothetical protein